MSTAMQAKVCTCVQIVIKIIIPKIFHAICCVFFFFYAFISTHTAKMETFSDLKNSCNSIAN
jgi:hypothetical protein